jgi:hypothetical protein
MDSHKTPLEQLIEKGLVIKSEQPKAKAPACYERGLQSKENLQRRIEVERQRRESEELRELTAAPVLCAKSVQLASKQHRGDFNTYSLRWKEERDQKIALSRLQETLRSDQSLRPKSPLPAPPGYKSPIRDWKSRYEQYQSTRSATPEAVTFHPAIDPASRKMVSGREPLEVRMQREEQERRKRIEAERSKANQSISQSLSFTPVVNQSAIERPANVAEHLYTVGVEAMKKKRELGEKGRPEGCTFRPELNKTNAELALKYRTKTPPLDSEQLLPGGKEQLSQERLKAFIERNYTQASLKAKGSHEDPECTFHPSTNSVHSQDCSKNLYARSMERLKASQAKLSSTRAKISQEQLAECTFQPSVLKRSATPPPYRSVSKPLIDSCSSVGLKPQERFSRDSTLCTIDTQDKREITYKYREKSYDLVVRCWEGQPTIVEEVETMESALKTVGIDW